MKLSIISALLLLILTIVAFVFVKPITILLPELAGVTCVEKWLCIDDIKKLESASLMYEKALVETQSKLTPMNKKPKVVFCSTKPCFSRFGFNKEAARSIGSIGAVIAPRGWQPHYIKHELIHQWQAEKLGSISVWLAPQWITEGMAYALSDDPRETLSEPFQRYREKYNNKFGHLQGQQLEIALRNEI